MKVLTIAGNMLRGTARNPTALFFSLVMPVMIIIIIGTTFGGPDTVPMGVTVLEPGRLAGEVAERLDDLETVEVERFDSGDAVRRAVRRHQIVGGVIVPAGYDDAIANGRPVAVELVSDPADADSELVRSAVDGIVAAHGARAVAAQAAAELVGGTLAENFAIAERVAGEAGAVEVAVDDVVRDEGEEEGGFDYTAPSNLVLFAFVNSLGLAAVMIEVRRLGIVRRMLATPTSATTVVAGETVGRLAYVLVQSSLILAIGALLFGVRWGDPAGVIALVLVFSLVSAGAGLLLSAVADSAELAGALGPPVGIAFAMLGGCMWPLEIVPEVMRQIGHLVPHAWAMDAWSALVFDGADLAGIATELAVLTGFAAVLLSLAVWRFRMTITRP